jgi:hypothetical protein
MISIQVDEKSVALVRREMEQYAKKKGTTMADLIDELAGHCGAQLARRVQPFGLSVAKMKKFQQSIGAQVARAVKNANITPGGGSADQAHNSRRNAKGQVPKGLPTGGQFKRRPIEISEREALAEKKKKAAGALKGAWLDAGRKSWPGLKVAKFFSPLMNNGGAIKRGRGWDHHVELTNTLNYGSKQMSDKDIKLALSQAYRGFMYFKIRSEFL